MDKKFNNLLKILELYKLKHIPRDSSNYYHDDKDKIEYKRRETTAEHVYSCIRLADFFLSTEKEFSTLDKIKVYELLMYHDDAEIITGDIGIIDYEKRKTKEKEEIKAIEKLYYKFPNILNDKLKKLDKEYRKRITNEAKFAYAIDKMDAMIHELQYPKDWGQKGWDESKVRKIHESKFRYSPTFTKYFEELMKYVNKNKYFEK